MQRINENTDGIIKAIIFDMDNTLFDFVEAKIKACEATVQHVDRKDTNALLNYFLRNGKGIENCENIADYLKDRNIFQTHIYQKCKEIYIQNKIDNIKPYDGVKETLERLRKRKLKMVIVTDASKENAYNRLKKAGLKKYFDFVISIENTGEKKPSLKPLIFALKKLDIQPNETLLIGDSNKRDIIPGKKIGMRTVYAAYGDRNFQESKKNYADYTINKFDEIYHILEKEM